MVFSQFLLAKQIRILIIFSTLIKILEVFVFDPHIIERHRKSLNDILEFFILFLI